MITGDYIQITAMWPECEIVDLGIKLKQGEQTLVAKNRADKSKDLKDEERLGSVHCDVIRKCRNLRASQPAPPSHRRLRRMPKTSVMPNLVLPPTEVIEPSKPSLPVVVEPVEPVIPAPVEPPAPVVNMEELALKVASLLGPVIAKSNAELLTKVQTVVNESAQTVPSVELPNFQEMLQDAVSAVQSNSSQGTSKVTVDDTPVYVPSNILRASTKESIKVQESTSTGVHLNDAAAKLKALRKKKGSKK